MDRIWTKGRRGARGAWTVAAVAGVAVALTVALVCFRSSRLPPERQSTFPNTPEATSRGEASSSVEIPVALLSTYYEHGLEHTPPRDPSGAMQRREWFYRAPPDAWDLISRHLGGGRGDVLLREQLDHLRTLWLSGRPIPEALPQTLEQSARQSSLDASILMDSGRSFEFLVGDEVAAAFFRAAFFRAQNEYAATAPGDPKALPLLRELDQTAALWRLKDYPGLEMRFRLARRLYPPLSVESRRAGCLLVDALYYQERFDEAADLILQVQKEHQEAGDLGALERSDLYEMEYMQGYVLRAAGRFAEAIPHLQRVCRSGEHAHAAAEALFSAFLNTGRFAEARACSADIVKRFNLSVAAQGAMQRRLDEAVLQQQWQREAAALN